MNETGQLEKIVGIQNISTDRDILIKYSGDLSFAPRIRPACIVKPENAGQVQKIVKWANETRTPVVPVSSGPPHFRGDSIPSVGGAVIVDMNGMKNIIRVDPKNRVAMIEPGVTFTELQTVLKKAGLSAYTPLCPRRSKSVIGSMLEREPITMPAHHWDATDPMLCAEIVFGTGDILRGGEAAGPDTIEEQWEIGKAQMTPMGLSQFNEHRLISGAQGSIGIVTWATLKCRYLSQLSRTLLIASDNLEPLVDFSYKLLRIRLGDHLLILNSLNMACLLARSASEIEGLKNILPPWILVVSFEGYGELPEEKVRYQEADFKDIARASHLEPAGAIPGVTAEQISKPLSGTSTGPYWKLKYRGSCHDIFFLTTLDKTPGFISAMSSLMNASRFPVESAGVYIQPTVHGTSCHCEFNLYTDPANQAETERVRQLVSERSRYLAKQGAFFSRPYGAWTDFAYSDAVETVLMQRKIKNIFDPNRILNPGKLCL